MIKIFLKKKRPRLTMVMVPTVIVVILHFLVVSDTAGEQVKKLLTVCAPLEMKKEKMEE